MSPLRKDFRELLEIAAPSAAAQLASMSFGVADAVMVGRVSRHAFAAAALGSVWMWGTLIFGMGVVFGMDPFVSQGYGARDGKAMSLALQHAVISALLVSIPIGLLWLPTGAGLAALGQDPQLAHDAARFVVLQIPGVAPFLVFTALRQWLVGRHIMAPAVFVLLAGNAVNVFLNWVLIYGHLGLRPMGLDGSAIATSVARFALLVMMLVWIRVGNLGRGTWHPWSRESFAWKGIATLFHYGLPVGLQMGLEVWAFQIATLMAGWLGETALSAHTAVLNLASISFMLPLGIGLGAGTLVGNRVGAGDLVGARRAARFSLAMGAAVQVLAAGLFVAFRWQFPRMYTPDAEVVAAAAAILPIAGAFQLFDGIQAVGAGVLRGMGLPRPAAVFNLLGYYGLALPMAWWMAKSEGLGLAGIWWGLALGLAVIAVALVFWIFRAEPERLVLSAS